MKKASILSTLTILIAAGAGAQSVVVPPGKIATFKAGDNTGIYNISTSKVQPCFVQVFDIATTNQSSPLYSLALPTNAPDGIWINAHAGSEGGGISRTINRQFLALEGYTGEILSPTASKPSSDPTVFRGLGVVDAFGNEHVLYQDQANWFGMPPGVTQNNPTGIASTDGTNFWGTGNVTGTSSEAAGTLFYNANFSSTPVEIQNYIQAAAQARVVGGTLYVVVPGQGVYNFVDPLNNNNVVPLPFDPNVPNPVEHVVLTNLFLNWGNNFTKIANFDMNAAGTIAYGADQTKGIAKFVNTNGSWTPASYSFTTTNLGTKVQTSGNQGCFGICVDFSGANPVIYATTMENGIVPNAQGHENQNRLIRIVDTGVSPGTNLVAQTLSTAQTTNEFYGGIDFTPDLSPLITSITPGHSTTNGGSVTYTVTADSVYPLSYQWLQNGGVLGGETNTSLVLSGLDTNSDGFTFQCVVTNQYGAVTSTPPSTLVVSASPVTPTITNNSIAVTGFVNSQITFAPIFPAGTEPFTFQWYQGATQLTDGSKYAGLTTASLTISNLTTADSGGYTLVASNGAGFASNQVYSLTVNYHLAAITAGFPPATNITFVGLSLSIPATQSGGTPPLTNKWFKGATAGTVTNALSDVGDINGSQTDTLVINPANTNDSGFYKVVVSNGGGSVTSSVALVTVLVPPPHSAVSYSNQLYTQNFDSLPDPGSNSVNSINNPKDPGSIRGVFYSLANPFDFTYPVITSGFVGGLGLSNTMPGWYGTADTTFPGVDGVTRFGAQDGDQTTGGVIDFGLNDNGGPNGTNRALGLTSTSTTGSTSFALKLVNNSGQTLNYVSLGFLGELWRNSTGVRTMSFGYTVDNTANSFVLSAQSISNSTIVPDLTFSFPTNTVQGVVLDGGQPANQKSLNVTNLVLSTPWTNNGALWLMWGIEFFGAGQGNGYAIDNLYFYATTNQAAPATTPLQLEGVSFSPVGGASFSFTNAPGAFFTVYFATNLTPPVNWQPLGSPTETPNGPYSTYSFTDPKTNSQARFYKVVNP